MCGGFTTFSAFSWQTLALLQKDQPGAALVNVPLSVTLGYLLAVLVTVGFFAAHSVASSWVGLRADRAKPQAAALYLFFYYMGASLVGVGGIWLWAFLWQLQGRSVLAIHDPSLPGRA